MMELKDRDKTNLASKLDMVEIIRLSKKLIEVIEEENKLLQENQMDSYQEVVNQKLTLVEKIEEIGLKFKENPEVLLQIDLSIKIELQELQRKLEVLKADNSLYLRAAIYSNKKISEIIKQILINRAKMKSGYCSKGLYSSEKKQGNKVPAMSYNTAT